MLFLETLVVLKSQSYLSITIEMHEIFQKTIEIESKETALSLSKKILRQEHLNYPIEIEKLLTK